MAMMADPPQTMMMMARVRTGMPEAALSGVAAGAAVGVRSVVVEATVVMR
jgi:hypothetical protein